MQISADFPYEHRYVAVFGSQMHYVEAGEGDPVLFIHGQPTSSYVWRNIMPYVAPHARAIAVDLIGMGKSDKPEIAYRYQDHIKYLEGFIEALNLKDVTLVVHDWGSTLGFDYAMRHEENIRGVAFMEALVPPAFPFPSYEALPEPAQDMFKGFRDPVKGRALLIDQNMFIERMLPTMIQRALREEEMDAYREPFLDPASREPLYRWPNELPIGGEPAYTDQLMKRTGAWLTETPLPKLHLYASPGAANPPEVAAWTAKHMKNIETVFVGPGLHFIQEDQPEAIGRALADWLRRLRSETSRSVHPINPKRRSTMSAYAIIQFEVHDAEQFEAYKKLAGPTVAAHGGRLLARGSKVELLEEQTPIPPDLVLVEFDSVEAARRWYTSPEYQKAIAAREEAVSITIAVIDGVGT